MSLLHYNGHCILRPPVQPEKYTCSFKLSMMKAVLEWRDTNICFDNISTVSLIAGLKMEGIVKWRGLTSQGPLCMLHFHFVYCNWPNHISCILYQADGSV